MYSTINIFSEKPNEIEKFLSLYYNKKQHIENKLYYEEVYTNPINMIEIMSSFADNSEKFEIAFWISLDKNVFININEYTINDVIKYLLERYPYF